MNAVERLKLAKEKAIEKPQIKVSKEFIDDFMLVSKHYLCSPDEIFLMKELARKDMDNAVVCFKSIAKEIRG